MLDEKYLKLLAGFYLVLIAAVRATIHAALFAALVAFAGGLLGLILSMKLRSLLLSLLIAPLCVLLIWIILLIPAGRAIALGTFLSELDDSSQELSRKLVTPVAFSLGGLILLQLLFSRHVGPGWLFGQEPLFGLAIGYFLAPFLIQKELLQRLIRSLEPN
ncbi:MAG: hypothetical protein L0214_00020 [candidate division NC10 bacterium]|nr:hypothetical protein [candidate division NC10 bacterium]